MSYREFVSLVKSELNRDFVIGKTAYLVADPTVRGEIVDKSICGKVCIHLYFSGMDIWYDYKDVEPAIFVKLGDGGKATVGDIVYLSEDNTRCEIVKVLNKYEIQVSATDSCKEMPKDPQAYRTSTIPDVIALFDTYLDELDEDE